MKQTRYAEGDVLGHTKCYTYFTCDVSRSYFSKVWHKVTSRTEATVRQSIRRSRYFFVCDIHFPRRKYARSRSANDDTSLHPGLRDGTEAKVSKTGRGSHRKQSKEQAY